MVGNQERRGRGGVPSWLPGPCPAWCTRAHHEHDHPEDRLHQDDGVVLATVLARVDPIRLHYVADPAELVVRRVRELPDDSPTWVVIAPSERRGPSLVLSHESAHLLRAALPREE